MFSARAVSHQFRQWQKNFKCGEKKMKLAKRKLATNVGQNSS
jgi:hypothetical protein